MSDILGDLSVLKEHVLRHDDDDAARIIQEAIDEIRRLRAAIASSPPKEKGE